MDITETLYVTSREAWRDWLAANYLDKSEIWLVSHIRAAKRPGILYHEAVEEALCFGWIDGIRKKHSPESHAQRFTPRRRGSGFSQINKERLARLIERGQVIPSVLAALGDLRLDDYHFPEDIMAALQADEQAWAFFQSTPSPYQRIRAAYVDTARERPQEFEKRLKNLVEKSARRKYFGYGIDDFYGTD